MYEVLDGRLIGATVSLLKGQYIDLRVLARSQQPDTEAQVQWGRLH